MRELRDRRDGGRVIATRRHFWRLLATFGTRVDRPRFGMAGEGVTAMIVAADAGDNPLADRREDRKAAAERERKARVAKVASQATNAMAAVRAQLELRERGAADKAANKANDDAGAPVRASSTMLERVFAARLDGPDKYVVARRKERKTARHPQRYYLLVPYPCSAAFDLWRRVGVCPSLAPQTEGGLRESKHGHHG